MDAQELVDIVLDIKHDLGKYLVLPVAMLPEDASEDQRRAALEQALHHTVRRGGQAFSAASLWARYRAEIGGALDAFPQWKAVCAAVERALALSPDADARQSVAALREVLGAVGRRCAQLAAAIRMEMP